MSSIDERIVQMRFDNKQFERGVATSLNTLDKLKNSLNLDAAAKEIENLQKTGNKFSLAGMATGIETMANKFSTLGIIGVTALQNITTAAMRTGAQIAKSLTIDPIMTGLNEYETKMNAITTILTNTQSKGTTLDDVNKALSELNEYADKTIYNFAEMTRNIGTFTAAGVDLDTSVKAIKGIANLAAGSGSTSQQASVAMYQLSQALAAGRVSLQDWNSVVNAGMGGELFQNALKETARQMGIVVDESVSFRESISATGGKASWLTSDVLIKTLESFADNETLVKAATQVKTITQLFDTMKESVQSGWAQSWEYIIGDRDQAIETLTAVSDGFNNIIGPSTDARNTMLKFWNQNGGRDALIQSMANSFQALADILGPVAKGFRDVFPPLTGEKLVEITERIKEITDSFKISDETTDKLRRTFKGAFSAIDLFRKGISNILSPFKKLGGVIKTMGGFLLDITATIGDFFTELNQYSSVNDTLSVTSSVFSGFATAVSAALVAFTDKLSGIIISITSVKDGVMNVVGIMVDGVASAIKWLSSNLSLGDIFKWIRTAGFLRTVNKISGFLDEVSSAIDTIFLGEERQKLIDNFNDTLNSLADSLNAFTSSIKIGSILMIAGAIGIISLAVTKLSEIDSYRLGPAMLGIAAILAAININFRAMLKYLSKWQSKGIISASLSLIAVAEAINIMASAVKKMSGLDLIQVGQGLMAIGVMLLELSLFLKATNLQSTSLKGSLALVVIAGAVNLLSDVILEFSKMCIEEIGKGLLTLGGALFGLCAAIKFIGKTKIDLGTSIAILAIAASTKILADSLGQFSSMSWPEIGRGLTAMGGALAELAVTVIALGKFGGGGALLGSVGVLIAAQSLNDISDALIPLSKLGWEAIVRGLTAMGGALAEVAIVTGALGKLAGASGLLGAGSLVIAVQSLEPIAETLERIGKLTWDEIGRGLVGMGGALGEVGVVTGALGTLTGLSGLLGAGTILVGVQGLGTLADALAKFGGMTWDEIKRGLVGMGGALTELGVVAGLLGALSPLSVLGSGSLLLGIEGLGDLANALKKFGDMSWEEIERGLSGMVAALGGTALGGLLNTLSLIGSLSISAMAEPLGILADSVKKWKDVSVPKDLSKQMDRLADGVGQFTFVMGTGALAKAAPALGELAGAMSKWKDISIPKGLKSGLKDLADGVQAFTWTFVGGLSMEVVRGPLSKLPKAIKKWNDVVIPPGIKDGLIELAEGIKAFTWDFLAGFSMGEVTKPLKSLAGAVKEWNGVIIPQGIGDGLSDIAKGLQSFAGVDAYSTNFTGIVEGIDSLGSAAKNLVGINFVDISTGLKTFADAIQSIPTQITDVGKSIRTSVSGIAEAISSQTGKIAVAFAGVIRTGLDTVKSETPKLASAGRVMIVTFVTSLSTELSRSKAKIQNGGKNLIMAFINGVQSMKASARSAVGSIGYEAAGTMDDYNGYYYNAGRDAIQGFINGMNSRKSSAISAAANVAAQALSAAKRRLDSHSPSKEFEKLGMDSDQGMINGLLALANRVRNTGSRVGQAAMAGVRAELTNLTNILSSDTDYVPTIRPVMDLSAVASGMSTMQSMFWNDSTLYPNFSGRNAQLAVSAIDQNRSPKPVRDYGPDVLNAFNVLGNRVDALGDRIAQMKMVLDSGAAVGGMSQKMDQKLGQMANYKGRNI